MRISKLLSWNSIAVAGFSLSPSLAHAESVGSLISSAVSDLSPAGTGLVFLFALIGVGIFGKGLLMLLNGGRGGSGVGVAILWLGVGVGLISITTLILASSGTLTNSGASTGMSKLGIGG